LKGKISKYEQKNKINIKKALQKRKKCYIIKCKNMQGIKTKQKTEQKVPSTEVKNGNCWRF
jgi:hypothetical protein